MRRARALLASRSGVWLLTSQGALSLGTLLMSVMVAREAPVREFAAFALALPFYVVAQRFPRVYLLIPRQIALNSHGVDEASSAPPIGECLGVAAIAAILMAAIAAMFSGIFGLWLWLLIALLPGLLLYDCLRNELVANYRLRSAAVMDFLWLMAQIVSTTLALLSDQSSIWFMVSWGLPPLVLAVVQWGCVGRSQGWRVDGVGSLLRGRGRLADGLSDLFSSVLVVQAVPYLVVYFASLEAAAGLRAGQMLLGPVNVVVMGVNPLLQMRTASTTGASQLRTVHRHILVLAVVCGIYGAAIAFLPDFLGRELLGATWPYTSVMLVALGVHLVVRTPFIAVTTALRSMGRQVDLVRQRVLGAVLLIVGAVIGAVSGVLPAIPWGMASAAAASTCVAYVVFRARRTTIGGAL